MMLKGKNIALLLLVAFVVIACRNASLPSGVLSEGDFEDVLYDMHLSHYLDFKKTADDTLSYEAHRYALTLDVLRKHDVTQAEWDSSMVYYTRHTMLLKEIYGNLYERLSVVAEGAGAAAEEAGADTTDIWQSERHLLLTSQRGYATKQWTIKADTLLKAGEKLQMQYLVLFLNNQAQSRLMSVISIRLKNDSVIVRNQVSTRNGIYQLDIEDDDNIGIQSVTGYFTVMHPQNAMFGAVEDSKQINSCQIVEIQDIRLTHKAPASPVPDAIKEAMNDSVALKTDSTETQDINGFTKPIPVQK